MSEVYSPTSTNYEFLDEYNNESEVPILKPNLVAPNIVAQVRQMQMLKAASTPPAIYSSYNTLTGTFCRKPQNESSNYQGLDCAYAAHRYPFQATSRVNPTADFKNVLKASLAQSAGNSQPKPSWYWQSTPFV